ncbi:MAG: nucleotidyltransferase family protein [Oscillospiraceae bacterium]|jgi:cytidyltransferase-like protein
MRLCGIICEYNPFHNGHLYQIEKAKQSGATHVIAVMSGNFVQRGDVAIIDKHVRAQMAVQCGADLVIELPLPFSIASAELFSKGAVHILNSLGNVDMLSFGSEAGNIEALKTAADASLRLSNNGEFKNLISTGLSYPAAIHSLIVNKYKTDISSVFKTPNNVLAIEYLKALKSSKSKIISYTILRKSVEHDSCCSVGKFSSASSIRSLIMSGKSCSDFLPEACVETIKSEIDNGKIASINNLEKIIFYKIISMSHEQLSALPDANNGLSDRIFKAVKTASSLSELLSFTKTKCFTLSRIRRVILYALLGITANDFKVLPAYGRILALNENGQEILADARKNATIPFSASLSRLSKKSSEAKRLTEIDELSGELFSLAKINYKSRQNEYTKTITRRQK